MSLSREVRRRARHIWGPALGITVVVYFLVHAFQGDRGIPAWVQLRQEIAAAEEQLAAIEAERAALAAHVHGLKSESLDPDLLEERARAMAGLVRPDEIVIFVGRSGEPR
jgi:cell division protein FtsB